MSDPTHNPDETPAAAPEGSTPAPADATPDPAPAADAASTEPAPISEPTASETSGVPESSTGGSASGAEPTSSPERPASDATVSAEPAPPTTPAPAASTYTGPTPPPPSAYDAPRPGAQPTATHPTTPLPGPSVATAPGTTGAPAATKDKKRSLAIPVVIALIAGAVVGGGSAAGVSALLNHGGSTPTTSSGNPQTITINDSGDVNAVTAIAKKAGPSVVTINVTSGQEAGTGSGVILDSSGYVLTNTHVVTLDGESGNGTVEVTTWDGKLYKAKVVGTDPIVDLAVIKLQDASGLTPIEFGDSSKLNVGDRVVAIGAPLGLSNTVTDGIVSALNRSIQIASSAAPKGNGGDQSSPNDNGGNGPFNFWNFGNGDGSDGNGGQQQQPAQSNQISLPVIQTDAAINPGNSGGALVDDSGKLVGINVAIASTGSTDASGQSGSIGVGFAIPADLAQRIANEIEKTGKGTHGLLGASVTDASADNSSTVGALIESVTNGGAAAKAGMQKGDVVTQLNGIPITSSTDLTAQVRSLAPGATAKITYIRGGDATTTTVTLGTLTS
jgi:putative serine protease PepD